MPLLHPAPRPGRLEESLDRAAKAIPPAWPLPSSVAVNPFLGQAGESLAQAGARLERLAGISLAMPRAWYRGKIASGAISDSDLEKAWSQAPASLRLARPDLVKRAALQDRAPMRALPTVAELAANTSGIDWPGVMADRIGAWLADYFDEGQALWAAPRGGGAYRAWKAVATHDLTPEIAGLAGFARHVADAPDDPIAALSRAIASLGLGPGALDSYFHQSLLQLGGWAQLGRYRLWRAQQRGASDPIVTELLAIRAIWDEALFLRYRDEIALAWSNSCWHHAQPVTPSADGMVDAILQDAWEHASQRELAQTLAQAPAAPLLKRPVLQAAFCIDVRSEIFRRALESLDPAIQTKGVAGFFGLAISHRRFASDVEEQRLPVLLNPALSSQAGGSAAADATARIRARGWRALDRFKLAAVSSFAFVEASGPFYMAKLLADAFGWRAPLQAEPAPRLASELDIGKRTQIAQSILRAMSFTRDFAPLVILMGHGAGVVNNPHAAALHCGACGGYPGDVNPRLLAGLLNDREVRSGLARLGIEIPADTLFVAGLHDTTSDRVLLYEDQSAPSHAAQIAGARIWLAKAGATARRERAARFPACGPEDLPKRGRDWAQPRPEWGLAGCNAFIAAPRSRTAGKNLGGRAFLHDYDWRQDRDFKVLELILTAPVVVASWISLQYYGSTVAPDLFGAGNKLLHNVVGGVGVLEGNGGMLRAGLPWQSVHDGTRLMHEPLRLTVCIEAPADAIADILCRHADVRALFDSRWLHLFTLNARGEMDKRYAGALGWAQDQAARPLAMEPEAL